MLNRSIITETLGELSALSPPPPSKPVINSELEQIMSVCSKGGISPAIANIIHEIMLEDGWNLASLLSYISGMVKEDDPYEYLRRGTDCTRY